MKSYNVITIFPDMCKLPFNQGVISKALDNKLIEINAINLRDFATDKHKSTDDYQFGGGVGLVMKVEPIYNALESIKSSLKDKGVDSSRHKVIILDPRGRRFQQKDAIELSKFDSLTFICGRYEGVDERVSEHLCDYQYSIGDYILTGGEPASMVMIDAIARLIDGVVGDKESLVDESFSASSLEYPHYTRPEEFMGWTVPKVLLSGDHKRIEEWRTDKSFTATEASRPDLVSIKDQSKASRLVEACKSFYDEPVKINLSLALMHYPMKDKQKDVVTTSITNLDIHDISRSSCTFGVDDFFIISPIKSQRDIANIVINHWVKGYGVEYNPNRSEAFSRTSIVSTLLDAIKKIKDKIGHKPIIVATTARSSRATISFKELSKLSSDEHVLLLFGTGWGFTEDIFEMVDFVLEPIEGVGGFNHLSVRSAVAIALSRLVNS